VRNSTGFYQIDAARFPGPGSNATCTDDASLIACIAEKSGGDSGDGPSVDPADCGCVNGNEGMRILANELRSMGYQWGSYNAMNGCENEECNIPALAEAKAQGFVVQDYQLMVEDWGSTSVNPHTHPPTTHTHTFIHIFTHTHTHTHTHSHTHTHTPPARPKTLKVRDGGLGGRP
jgi:hypothetical protein